MVKRPTGRRAGRQVENEAGLRLREDALRYLIPHFASNEALDAGPRIFTRGEGCYLIDWEGKRYLDTFASLLTTICGHCHPRLNAALESQLSQLEFFPNYEDAFTVPLIQLARRLARICPGDLEVSFLVNSGSEANEAAIKMARQYHAALGRPHRYKIVARKASYHGTTLGGLSATGLPWFRSSFEPLLPGFVFAPPARSEDVELQSLTALREIVEWENPSSVAALILDPIPGSNTGYPLPPPGYLQGVRELCDRHGILLIFDEVQTGFGKTGKWFACQHWGVTPDILCLGKAMTGGYVPLSATVVTPRLADVFRAGPGHEFRSGSTFGGHTLACAAALACLDVIEEEDLVERAVQNGAYLAERLTQLRRHPIVGSIGGIGLLRAVGLVADSRTGKPLNPQLQVGRWINRWCYEHGLIVRNNGEILVLAPPLIITRQELDFAVEQIDRAIEAAVRHFGF